jgi:hypothetical protein
MLRNDLPLHRIPEEGVLTYLLEPHPAHLWLLVPFPVVPPLSTPHFPGFSAASFFCRMHKESSGTRNGDLWSPHGLDRVARAVFTELVFARCEKQ